MNPMSRPTFSRIAAAAGVSLSTVERVLNGRGGVRRDKVQRVIIAASDLGYDRRLPEVHRGMTRIELILSRPETPFFTRLVDAFVNMAGTLDEKVTLHRTLIAQDPAECVARINAKGLRRSGLIITAPDHPDVRDALRAVQEEGTPVIQLVTRTVGLHADYVGIDNYAAGRTAAMFISRMCRRAGHVLALCPIERYVAHKDRLRGFSDYFGASPNPDLSFSQILLGREEGSFSAALLREVLDDHPSVAAFYNCGGLNGVLCDVFRNHPTGQGVFFVGHELTQRSSAALSDGTMQVILDQVPEVQARCALDLMLQRIGLLRESIENKPIRFTTITAENL